jgi:hypothetical protein
MPSSRPQETTPVTVETLTYAALAERLKISSGLTA